MAKMPAVRGDGMRGKITWMEMNFFCDAFVSDLL